MLRGTVVKVDGKVVVGDRAETVGLGVSTYEGIKKLELGRKDEKSVGKILTKMKSGLLVPRINLMKINL